MTPAIFGLAGPQLTADESAFFREADPAGYVLFARNCQTREQMRALTADLCAIHGRERTLVSIDQEGGRVARMKPPEWAAFPPGQLFAQLWQIAPASAIEAARVNAEALGLDLAEVGVTVDYMPLLDVRQEGADDVIGDRALGSEPMQVAALGRAVLEGLGRAGITGCVKHMPGHGRAQCDSHKQLPEVSASEAELERDIEPFRALAHAAMGMTAHVRYSVWDADNPATLSEFIVGEIIRKRIGFSGLLLTDDIDMAALSGSVPERGARALAAGCDVVLNCWAKMDDMTGLANGLPAMTAAAVERLERALTSPSGELSADRAGLLAKRDALLAAAGVPA